MTFPSLVKLILAAALMTATNVDAVNLHEHPYDKGAHLAVGAVVSCAVTAATEEPLYGFLAGVLVGYAKERYDPVFDNADWTATGIGGAIGTLCINF